MLKKEEGGRHTPFFKGYRPQFYFRTTDVTGPNNVSSKNHKKIPSMIAKTKTITVEPISSCLLDQDTFFISSLMLEK